MEVDPQNIMKETGEISKKEEVNSFVDFDETFSIEGNSTVVKLHLSRLEDAGSPVAASARYFAERLLAGEISVGGKSVLELGGGGTGGVPSMLAASALGNARTVVASTNKSPQDEETAVAGGSELSLLQRNLIQNSGGQAEEKQEEDGVKKNMDNKLPVVAPSSVRLVWGDDDDMTAAMEHTGGNGFDVLVMCDVLLHGGQDGSSSYHTDAGLIQTISKCLAKDRRAVAYLIPSPLSTNWSSFFKRLAEYGLVWRKMGTGDDNASSACTSHHFEISHTFDAAGPPLDVTSYDVLIQGTGLTECIVSASLARAGKKVLQVDPSGHYGGVHFTGNVPQFKKFIMEEVDKISPSRGGEASEPGAASTTTTTGAGSCSSSPRQECAAKILHEAEGSEGCIRDYALDFSPLLYLANSTLIDHLMESNTARYVEFMNVERLLVATPAALLPLEAAEDVDALSPIYPSTTSLSRVPLKRADVFKHCKWLSPMEMRNLMKFVTVVEQKMKQDGEGLDSEEEREKSKKEKEEEDAAAASAAGGGDVTNTEKKKKSAIAAPPTFDGTFHQMLKTKFKLGQKSQDLLTLHGHLIDDQVPADQGIDVVGRFMSSVGRFEGETPFLVAQYGASELPQNMARVSAVWGSTFVLQRHVTKVVVVNSTPPPPPPSSPCSSSSADPVVRVQATMSNGQIITAKQFIAPRTVLSASQSSTPSSTREGLRMVRAVIVLRQPFISWEDLQTKCGDVPEEEDEQKRRVVWPVPETVAVLNVPEKQNSVTLLQLGGTSQHAPRVPAGTCIVHLLADESCVSLLEMESVVNEHFLHSAAQRANTVFASIFVAIEAAFGGSPISTEDAIEEDPLEKTSPVEGEEEGEESQRSSTKEKKKKKILHPRVIPVQTMFTGFNDGAFSTEAAKVFNQVYEAEGLPESDRPDFLEFIPEHPSQVTLGDNDDDARLLGVQE